MMQNLKRCRWFAFASLTAVLGASAAWMYAEPTGTPQAAQWCAPGQWSSQAGYIVRGIAEKNKGGALYIKFPDGINFPSPPTVVVTSCWPHKGVGQIETIKSITTRGFTVHSGNHTNHGVTYYVSWIAVY